MGKQKLVTVVVMLLTLWFCPHAARAEPHDDPYQKISSYLKESFEKAHIPGAAVMVVDKSQVLLAQTYGLGVTLDKPFIIGSTTKSFTAIAIMQLVEQGLITLDTKLSTYYPNISGSDKITIKHLLNQTSGLGEYQRMSNAAITDTYGKHQYANVNYSLLGKIIEAVSGMSYEDYVSQAIFTPLGMTHSAASLQKSLDKGLIDGYRNYFGFPIAGAPDYPNERSWSQVPAGYISSSASDMGRYLQMYLNDGGHLMKKESIAAMFYDNVEVPTKPPYSYGMGWTLAETHNQPVLGHTGLVENFMSNMFILPESGIGVVVLANTNDYLVTQNLMNTISGSLVLMLLGEAPVAISGGKYMMAHLLLNSVYLVLFVMALWPLLRLKRYKVKQQTRQLSMVLLRIGLLHLAVPTFLLLLPPLLLATPLWVVRSYVPDLFLVLLTTSSLLYLGGVLKALTLRQRSG